ncbi:hypothetical protein J6590_036701 [Homalodisca vitripennis]|nr:hypothetical protein J6590_036701 [Homalodisca vitripennis]
MHLKKSHANRLGKVSSSTGTYPSPKGSAFVLCQLSGAPSGILGGPVFAAPAILGREICDISGSHMVPVRAARFISGPHLCSGPGPFPIHSAAFCLPLDLGSLCK